MWTKFFYAPILYFFLSHCPIRVRFESTRPFLSAPNFFVLSFIFTLPHPDCGWTPSRGALAAIRAEGEGIEGGREDEGDEKDTATAQATECYFEQQALHCTGIAMYMGQLARLRACLVRQSIYCWQKSHKSFKSLT
jgi:hypothetical protein